MSIIRFFITAFLLFLTSLSFGQSEFFFGGGGVPSGEQLFTVTGTQSWTVPDGVTSICAVAVGSGSGGFLGYPSKSGTGGALAYVNDIPVTPGETLTIEVGASNLLDDGESSGVKRSTTWLVHAGGGTRPLGTYGDQGSGGVVYVGTGGAGGLAGLSTTNGAGYESEGGGGGAGGWSGPGGDGGDGEVNGVSSNADGGNGSGGAGGGGAGTVLSFSSTINGRGGAGGGVGVINGAGSSGVGGDGSNAMGEAGYGGSGGGDGNSTDLGGEYGGGSGSLNNNGGGQGVVYIIWGEGRSFPNNVN